MKLTDNIYYDSIEVIYYVEKDDLTPHAFFMVLVFTNVKTYKDLFEYIEKTDNVKINSMLIIAELGLDGIVLRWNKHDGLYQVGTTRGYA